MAAIVVVSALGSSVSTFTRHHAVERGAANVSDVIYLDAAASTPLAPEALDATMTAL